MKTLNSKFSQQKSPSPPAKKNTPLPLPSPALWQQSPVSLPSSPGVYWFLDSKNNVIYVGKAKNLNDRLRSYSHLNKLLPKTAKMVTTSAAVKYQVLQTELEALLVEAELIRLHQPHFNILLKDDKSPLYIIITKEKYPKVLSVRKTDLFHSKYMIDRSFGPFPSGKQVRSVLKIARRIFPYCNASIKDQITKKACLYSHIGLCPGACTGAISPKAYKSNITQLKKFLIGKHTKIVKELTQKIYEAAKLEDFETANELKLKVESINYIVSHYRIKMDDQPLPNLQEDKIKYGQLELLRLLQAKGLNLTRIDRIETYDVANLQGTSPTVSMVVSQNGTISKQHYRHFTIRSLNTPNDVGMLREALTRRQRHPEWGIPDLIIVDGGRPQLKAVSSVLKWNVPLFGIAKNPDRLLLVIQKDPLIIHSHLIVAGHPATNLLISLRDEAHRFARRLHHLHHEQKLLNQTG